MNNKSLGEIDLSKNLLLVELFLNNNKITSIDLTHNNNLA